MLTEPSPVGQQPSIPFATFDLSRRTNLSSPRPLVTIIFKMHSSLFFATLVASAAALPGLIEDYGTAPPDGTVPPAGTTAPPAGTYAPPVLDPVPTICATVSRVLKAEYVVATDFCNSWLDIPMKTHYETETM